MMTVFGPNSSGTMAGFTGIAILVGIWTIVVTIIWLVIGWRAMRAHERLTEAHVVVADALSKMANKKAALPASPPDLPPQ